MENVQEMKKFVGVKVVLAAPMDLGTYNAYRGWTMPKDECPNKEGFLVRYEDGYESWCPKEQFEGANRRVDGMTFGHAIEAAKIGKKIARKGWNGKGQFVFYLCATALEKATGCYGELLGEPQTTPALAIKTSIGQVQVGWLASQSDMLSDDWQIVD